MAGDILIALSTFFAAVAAIAAVVGVVFAWRSLKAGNSMITELGKLIGAARSQTAAAKATTAATTSVARRLESANATLASLLDDAQAARDLDYLYRVAGQVREVAIVRQELRTAYEQHNPQPWRAVQDAQRLLAASLEAVAPEVLPKCHELITADPRFTPILDDDASLEIKEAITQARVRLAELSHSRPQTEG